MCNMVLYLLKNVLFSSRFWLELLVPRTCNIKGIDEKHLLLVNSRFGASTVSKESLAFVDILVEI